MIEHRIAWRSKITGHTSHGEWYEGLLFCIADDHVERLNERWPDLEHWIEKRETEVPND